MAEAKTDGGRTPVTTAAAVAIAAGAPAPQAPLGPPAQSSDEQRLAKDAEERERRMARTRGLDDDELDQLAENTVWVQSNRRDDRVVLWERDPRHPGGEAHIGPSPTRVYKTPGVQEKLFRLEAREVPAPRRMIKVVDEETGEHVLVPNRKYPPDPGPDPAVVVATQPGKPIPIGRELDPDLYDEEQRKAHKLLLRQLPSELPVPQNTVVGGV